jgi:hypothetical protein
LFHLERHLHALCDAPTQATVVCAENCREFHKRICLWRRASHLATILPVKFPATKRNSGIPNFTVQDRAFRTKPDNESFCRRRRRQIDRKGCSSIDSGPRDLCVH